VLLFFKFQLELYLLQLLSQLATEQVVVFCSPLWYSVHVPGAKLTRKCCIILH